MLIEMDGIAGLPWKMSKIPGSVYTPIGESLPSEEGKSNKDKFKRENHSIPNTYFLLCI